MSSVVAQPLFSFGLRTGVRNSVSFCDENTVVFPCGNTCVCYNTSRRSQRFIPGSEKSQGMHALALSPNRRYLAVSECGERASITVFDLQHEQGRKRKVLTAGESSAEEFVCMAFSHDSKYLIGQTGGPDWTLIFWLWEKQKVLATVKTSTSHKPVSQVSFNPHNNTQLCVSGGGVLKLFRYSEGALKQSSSPKVESIFFLCHSWVTEERVIAGTDSGRLLVFESGDLRREINTSAQETDRQVAMKKMKDSDVDEGVSVPRITAILSCSKGFICSYGAGTVCLFEKTKEDGYRRTRDIRIPADSSDLTPAESQLIDTMCLSPSEETLVLSTERGQLYSFSLSSLDINKEEPHFEFLSQSFHSKSITGLSVCIRKPLAATSSLDHSVRIWNYETKVLELYKEFPEEALSVALHPTGLFVLVGFSDKLRLMNLLIDDIRTFKEFAVRGCRECAFSHGGHMFAAVNGNVIHIYSVTSFENILNLKGHNGKVRGIEWSLDDGRLVSCGMDGAVYEWNAQTGKRESESVLKSCSYTDVSFSSDGKTILAVGTDLTLKEIQDCQVLREVPADEVAHTAVAVSHSGRVVFTGTPRGTIRAVKYPLPLQKDWITYQAHCGPITKMVFTWDDQFLLTAAEDGCLLMWKVVDKEGRGLKSNRQIIQTEEILVTKADLEEKAMKTEMEKQQRESQMSTAEISEKHSEELEALEESYSQKLITEHERFQDLQRESERMQEDFEKQLKDVEGGRVHTVEELKQNYEAKLEEKDLILLQCQEDARQQIREFQEVVRQVEEDEERKIHDIQVKYEKRLHTEEETSTSLKGEARLMTQKSLSLQRQIDERCSELKQLKQERQRLLGLIRSLESDIEDLKRTVSGHEKASQDKDKTICSLKKKNQELEKLKFVLDFQLNEMKSQTEPQQEDIVEKKERIHQLQEELVQIDKGNTQLKLSVSELRLKLRTRDKEMHKEAQKVKDLETHLQRLKADLHNCVGFIQEPKKLKDSMQTIYARYVADGVEQSGVEEEIQRAFCRQRDHLEKTVNGLKTRLAKSAEQHEQVYVKIMKENVGLITEINELRKELLLQRTQVKDYKSQLSVLKKSKRARPHSEQGTEKVASA
ncbi:cilia- and flagella-associated protein 57 isoform X2 [Pseudochaenichthys georgianus]|uniref:cilia- and flagella-associated protein 57 isoform X2 n=1 Tax=Pseudochaenichthys georgianus TaxID=52239 RepID=UPI00146F8980|nr:cilia- and flagella-associated protein 57 isoform X2 [Pseudochaenichthys georgianus]